MRIKFIVPLCILMLLQGGLACAGELQAGQRIKLDVDTVRHERFLLFFKIPFKSHVSITGRIVSFNADTISIIDENHGGDIRHLPASEINRIYVPDGRTRATWTGCQAGAACGLLIGMIGVLGDPAVTYSDSAFGFGPKVRDESRDVDFVITSVLGGGIVGAIAGTFMWKDRWQPLDRSDWSIGLTNDSTGTFGLKVSLLL